MSHQRERPVLVLISHQKTIIFLNEDEMVIMMEDLGFQVCDCKAQDDVEFGKGFQVGEFMVGAHGAGLAYELFLPKGAVMVQVEPLGLEWPLDRYFGEPAHEMGVQYLEYKIEPEESSLFRLFEQDHPVIDVDPASAFSNGYQADRALGKTWR